MGRIRRLRNGSLVGFPPFLRRQHVQKTVAAIARTTPSATPTPMPIPAVSTVDRPPLMTGHPAPKTKDSKPRHRSIELVFP
ncbi:hypothetical protein PG994_013476 [Apiospora phragmitis]|uniref:Uncharacterized protein n=1 Tax=Apiospora phragmitis TaxID=2905665 RepID=A0ABR1TBA2_9PEZI